MKRKYYDVVNFCRRQENPFTIDSIHANMKVSSSTIYRALRSNVMDNYYVNQPKGGHFYKLIFPSGWTREQVIKYLNDSCKSGKSRAKLHYYGKKF